MSMLKTTMTKKPAILAALLAVAVSILLSSPHWIAWILPSHTGLLPAISPRPWAFTPEDLENIDLRGQSALVTGANSGIGLEISRALSRRGASVTMACRNPRRCFAAVDSIRREEEYSGAPVSPLVMDVSDLASVRLAARTFLKHDEDDKLDMLFLNAGILNNRHEEGADLLPLSKDGIEKVFATNMAGHHLLYRLLEPALANSTTARVVSTSSMAGLLFLPPYGLPQRFGDETPLVPATLEELNDQNPLPLPLVLYGRSKLAQVAWSKALTRRLGEKSNIYVNSANPGAVFTPAPLVALKNFWPSLPQFVEDMVLYLEERLLWTAAEGALTELYLGVAVDEIRSKDLRGRYFHPQAVEVDHPHAEDEGLQEDVWGLCEELVKGFL